MVIVEAVSPHQRGVAIRRQVSEIVGTLHAPAAVPTLVAMIPLEQEGGRLHLGHQ